MSRLIDADKLLKLLDNDMEITSKFVDKSIKENNDNDYLQFINQFNTLECYRSIVEDLPTAFDVDKVAGQIEDLKEENFKRGIKENEPALLYASSCLHKALDIVKRGGLDD